MHGAEYGQHQAGPRTPEDISALKNDFGSAALTQSGLGYIRDAYPKFARLRQESPVPSAVHEVSSTRSAARHEPLSGARLEMITLFLFGDGGAVGFGGGLRRDGGLNSSGVAPTPMHPAATGQLRG